MGSAVRLMALMACLLPSIVCADDEAPKWVVGIRHDFGQATLGGVYEVRKGSASIKDGRLELSGEEPYVLINSPIMRDIRFEFDAEPLAGATPGSIGALLHSITGEHYALELGARQNRLSGPGLNLVDDRRLLAVEPGKTYHVSLQREGKRIWCTVDDKVILDGMVEKIVGQIGTQRLVLFSDRGMMVDNVRVSQRVPYHPDSFPFPVPPLPVRWIKGQYRVADGVTVPGLEQAVQALNECRFEEAKKLFTAVEDVTVRMAGLACMYGDINYYERPVYGDLSGNKQITEYTDAEVEACFGELGVFALLWKSEMQKHPDNQALKDYWPVVESFGRLCLNRRFALTYSDKLFSFDERINPFFYKAKLYDARARYWNGMEGGNQQVKAEARADMKWLLRVREDNRVVNEYAGTPVPWGEELTADPTKHPAWAAYLREAYARELAILNRFCEVRQMPDGQYGGGWGDDVEMLRLWVAITAISTCSDRVADGIERLANGVWDIRCVGGYDKGTSDVEHSSECSADTFPTMLLLRYGDPLWVERNIRSCKTIKETFMGIDQKGHPRFKSSVFGVDGVHAGCGSGGDSGYSARPMKHFLWASWYGSSAAEDWYLRWVNGWREMALLDAPDKPAGVLPGDIWFPSGSYMPLPCSKAAWYTDDRAHAYGPFGVTTMIFDSFLAAYSVSNDRKFLQPIELLMDWASLGPLDRGDDHDKHRPGTREWFRLPMAHAHAPQHTALYRHFTGVRAYDEYTLRFGTPPQKYQVNHDLDAYMRDIESAAKSLRNNLWYYTTEVMSTDRLHLPAVPTIFGAYTGAITTTRDAEAPTFAVTYDTPSSDFAALVVDSGPERLRVWLYSFWDKPTEIGLRLWALKPGHYVLSQGEQARGEFPFQNRYLWEEQRRVPVLHRADEVRVTLPPGKVYVVDLRLDTPVEVPARLADLAIGPADVQVSDGGARVTVHNIGTASADAFRVSFQRRDGETWKTLASKTVPGLAEPANLEPSVVSVDFAVPGSPSGDYRAVVDPDKSVQEICETNNAAVAAR